MRVLVFADQSLARQTFIHEALNALGKRGVRARTIYRIAKRSGDPYDDALAVHVDRTIVRRRHNIALLPLLMAGRAASSRYREFLDSYAPWAQVGAQTGAAHSIHWTAILARTFRWNPHFLFAHFAWNLPIALPFARLLRRPLICVLHGSDVWLHQDWKEFLPDPAVKRIFCVSQGIKDHVDSTLPGISGKTKVVKNPVSPIFLRPPVAPPPQLTIVCVAALTVLKNQIWLLRALSILKGRGVAFQCHLIGDALPSEPSTPASLRQAINEHGLGDSTSLTGWLTPDQTATAIDGSTVLVLPSKSEGLPMVIVEALARQRSPVATRLPGTLEALNGGAFGHLCELNDDEALADAILAAHNETTQVGERIIAGRAYIELQHGADQYSEAVLQTVKDIRL